MTENYLSVTYWVESVTLVIQMSPRTGKFTLKYHLHFPGLTASQIWLLSAEAGGYTHFPLIGLI